MYEMKMEKETGAVFSKCPNCGAAITKDPDSGKVYCQYCGASSWQEQNSYFEEARRVMMQRGPAWEYRSFALALMAELEVARNHSDSSQKMELTPVSLGEYGHWALRQLKDLQELSNDFKTCYESSVEMAIGPPGVPGNSDQIFILAKRLAKYYRQVLEWKKRIRDTVAYEAFRETTFLLSDLSRNMIQAIEGFGPRVLSQLDTMIRKGSHGSCTLDLNIAISKEDLDKLTFSIEKATEQL